MLDKYELVTQYRIRWTREFKETIGKHNQNVTKYTTISLNPDYSNRKCDPCFSFLCKKQSHLI